MSDSKYSENDPERTLITLDQLSQTIEVMTSVVNRLRQHLSQQIEASHDIEETKKTRILEDQRLEAKPDERESYVVEIAQPEAETDTKDDKTFH